MLSFFIPAENRWTRWLILLLKKTYRFSITFMVFPLRDLASTMPPQWLSVVGSVSSPSARQPSKALAPRGSAVVRNSVALSRVFKQNA